MVGPLQAVSPLLRAIRREAWPCHSQPARVVCVGFFFQVNSLPVCEKGPLWPEHREIRHGQVLSKRPSKAPPGWMQIPRRPGVPHFTGVLVAAL